MPRGSKRHLRSRCRSRSPHLRRRWANAPGSIVKALDRKRPRPPPRLAGKWQSQHKYVHRTMRCRLGLQRELLRHPLSTGRRCPSGTVRRHPLWRCNLPRPNVPTTAPTAYLRSMLRPAPRSERCANSKSNAITPSPKPKANLAIQPMKQSSLRHNGKRSPLGAANLLRR